MIFKTPGKNVKHISFTDIISTKWLAPQLNCWSCWVLVLCPFSSSSLLSPRSNSLALFCPQPILEQQQQQQQKPIKYTIRVTNVSLAFYNRALWIFHSDKCSVIFLSSQQAVKTLLSFVTVHMSNWQSAHSVRLEKNLFNVCPTRRHKVWLAEMESGFWSCVLTCSSSSCLLSWRAPHYPFTQQWQSTVPLPGCSHTQWVLGWVQCHWLNISLFQDKQVVWIKVGQNRLNIIKRGYKTRIEWCSASLHSLGDSWADRGNKEEQNS